MTHGLVFQAKGKSNHHAPEFLTSGFLYKGIRSPHARMIRLTCRTIIDKLHDRCLCAGQASSPTKAIL